MNTSCRFWSQTKTVPDPDEIWYGLCEGGAKRQKSIQCCQVFLRVYAIHRKRYRVSLGPEEKEAQQLVNHGITLITVWKLLVLHFNRTVLLRKRREDPANAKQWDLSFRDGLFTTRGHGPVSLVNQVRISPIRLQQYPPPLSPPTPHITKFQITNLKNIVDPS